MALTVGEAFLQVTPSLQGLHEKIAAEVASLPDITIPVSPQMDQFREKVAAETADLKADVAVGPKLDQFREKVAAETADLKPAEVPVTPKVETAKADAEIGAFATEMTAKITAAVKAIPNIEIKGTLNATEIETTAERLRAEFIAMREFTVTGKFDDAEFLVKLHAMEAELRDLAARSVDVKAKFDYLTAANQIAAFKAQVEKTIEVKVETEKASTDIGAFAAKMRATMAAAVDSLPEIVLHEDDTEVRRKNVLIRAELEDMREFTMHGNFDDDEMLAKLAKLKAELEDMAAKEVNVRAKFDYLAAAADIAKFQALVEKGTELKVKTDQANAEIGAFATGVRTKIEAAIKAIPALKLTAESTQAEQRIAAVRTLLESLKDKKIGIDITKERFDATMTVINAELTALGKKEISIPIKADANAALKALKDIGTESDNAKGKLSGLSSAFDSFASIMSTKAGLIAGSIQPLLASIGQLSGALGLLPAIATAAGQGFAALKVGTMGVSESIKDFTKLDDLAAKAADGNAKAQQAQATASQANAAAGKGNVDVLKQQVAESAAVVAGLTAQKGAHSGVSTAVQQATTAHQQLVAQLKQAEAAHAGNVAQLKQEVLQSSANLASLKANTSAQAGSNTALAEAKQKHLDLVAALKASEAGLTGNTAAQGTSKAATDAAKLATSEATSAQKAYDKALEDYRNSLTNLAPAAADFVVQVARMDQSFKDLKLDVQGHLFDGLADKLKSLGTDVIPTVRTGLTQMADAINTAVKNIADFVTKQSSVAAWKEIFANNSVAATNFAGAVKPILQIITDLVQVGSQLLPGLATGFANAAQKAADFVSKAKDTGQLKQWIQDGITALGQLWTILKNVVIIIKDLATAPGFSPSFLGTLAAVTTGLQTILTKMPALTTVVNAFFAAWTFAKIMSGITGMITKIAEAGTALSNNATKVKEFVTALETFATAEGTAGAAAAAAGLSIGALALPIAGVGVAIAGLVLKWDNFVKGFHDANALLITTGKDIVDMTKAIADAFTGNFAAAGRAFDDINKRDKDLQTQLGKTAGTDSAKKSADDLTTSIDKTNTAMQAQTTQLASSLTAEVDFHTKLDAVTQSIKDNGTSLDLNTTAGRNNISAVTDMITSAQNLETAAQTEGKSTQDLAKLHDDLSKSIQGATAQMPLQGTALGTLVQQFVTAGPKMSLKPTLDPSQIIAGVKTVQDLANSIKNPPPIAFTGNADDIKAKAGEAKTAAAPPPQPPATKFTGDASDIQAKSQQATTAANAPPPMHNTTFIGIVDDINNAANSVTTLIGGVVQKWLTSFFGDTTNLSAGATSANSLIDSVKSTHGSTFTGDASGLSATVATANAGIATVNPAPPVVKFTADITDITAKTATATTQIAAVALTHVTTITGDLTGATGVTQSAADATKQITAIPLTHKTTLTIDDAAALQQIQQFTAAINAIPTTHVTTLSTVQGAAGGGIVMKMAIGGVVPMATGGTTPMSASKATIVPPNTMRLIGDRPIGDEAFIPINNSGVSQAILGETANRMGKRVIPLGRGGRSWRDEDDDFWEWFSHRGGGSRGGGGPSSSGSTLTPGAAAVDDMRRSTSMYQAVGGTASISSMKAYHPSERPPPASAATPAPVNIKCDTSQLGRLLMEIFRNSVRAQGGNVQLVLGS